LVATLPSSQAQFWRNDPPRSLGWSVAARVDGTAYNLFGGPKAENGTQSASVIAAEYTSTHTIFTLTAGNAQFKLDFLSPVSPTDYVRQSLPFGYLTVHASGINGKAPNIQVYSDIDGLWTGQDSSTNIKFNTSCDTSIYQLRTTGATEFQELNDMALWGTAVYASRPCNGSKLSVASGPFSSVRSQFVKNGKLDGSQ